jgi:hypothetical protein
VVWLTPPASQNEPDVTAAGAARNRTAVVYVQRSRPALVCDNASTRLPWRRNDSREYYSGDNGLLHSEWRECEGGEKLSGA